MRLLSDAFTDMAPLPTRHTCEGEGVSPGFRWSGAPTETWSFAFIGDDHDAPGGVFCHWAVHDIAADAEGLPEGAGAARGPFPQAVNDFGKTGYGPPCPPRGDKPHRYRFRVLALSVTRLDIAQGSDCAAVVAAAERSSVAAATVTGTYGRR